MTATDALEFMLVGATAIQIGTANFLDPSAAQTIARGMERYLAENNIADVKSLIGALEL
jgi:dihydroorotate dehydrogenase (NAD+) catalytic subunit